MIASPPAPRTVAHIVTSFGVGGTERQLVELLRGLDRRRWRPRLICFRRSGAFLRDIERMDLHPDELSLGGTLLRPQTALAIARIAAWIRAQDAALVHCHDVYSVLLGVPAARLAGVPVIASRRDLGHHVTPLQRPLLRLALRQADRVLANAATVASQLEHDDGVPAERLAIVPNGLDVVAFDARARALAAPAPVGDGGPPTVVVVARMTYPAKGHDDLLRAAALVHKTVPEIRFVLVGDGPRESALRRLAAELGIEPIVHFIGRRPDVPALLVRADLVCHPSRMEGLPNAVMEAMAAARPIVATAVGGTPELVRDGVHAILVAPEAPEELAHALLELLADPARGAALGRAARERVERSFNLAALVERVERLYAEMCGGYSV
jgi:glycosyltransferase involved in cell wall biosynthesis